VRAFRAGVPGTRPAHREPARQPALLEWVEDLVFTGLLFVAATQLLYEVLGRSLETA
jgi:hypothetical protein